MKAIIVLVAFLFMPIGIMAQKLCAQDSTYRQFDFWLGEWEAYGLKGKKAGDSRISLILDSCVVLEEWLSAATQQGLRYEGKSYNTYNQSTQQWQQTWVDNMGGNTEYLEGKYEEGKMTFLSLPFPIAKDSMAVRRLTFYRLDANKVRQHGEISKDKGASWTTEYDLEYRRKNSEGISKRALIMVGAFIDNNMEAVATFYSDKARIIGDGFEIAGKEAIKGYWEKWKDKGALWQLTINTIEASGQTAIQSGESLFLVKEKGVEKQTEVRYTWVWEKNSAGIWEIVLEHFSKK